METDWDELLSYLGPSQQIEEADDDSYEYNAVEQPEAELDDDEQTIQDMSPHYGYEDTQDEDEDDLDLDTIIGNSAWKQDDLSVSEYAQQQGDTPQGGGSLQGYTGLANYNMAGNVADKIAQRESGHVKDPYSARALDSKGNEVSSATGKYQFLWGTHGSWIEKQTGVHSRAEFLASPEAQEKAFAFWDKTTLTPEAMKFYPAIVKAIPGADLDDVKMMIHFAGAGAVAKAVREGNYDKKLDAFGSSIRSYIGK